MRLLLRGLLVTAVLLVPTACGEDDDEPAGGSVTAAVLPDPLCDAVPDTVVDRWSLVAQPGGAADGDDDRREVACEMAGTTDDGEDVTLEVQVVTFGGTSTAAVRDRIEQDLEGRCEELERGAAEDATLEQAEGRCSVTSADGGTVTEVSRGLAPLGVVTVSMTAGGDGASLVGAEVVGLSGHFANTDPEELG